MPGYGVTGVQVGIQLPATGAGGAFQPSAAVFADCPGPQLEDSGTGFNKFDSYIADATLPGLPNTTVVGTSAGFTYDTNFDSVMIVSAGTETGSAGTVSASYWTKPGATTVLRSGNRFWLEQDIAVVDLTVAKGIFVGIADKNAIANGIFTSVSASLASNVLTTGTSSFVGFWMHGDNLGNFDLVYNNVTNTLGLTTVSGTAQTTAAATVANGYILTNVLTNSSQDNNPANTEQIPTAPFGTLVAATSTSLNSVKLGLRYDGQQYLYAYIEGNLLTRFDITGALDQSAHYGFFTEISGLTTTAVATAPRFETSFYRYAFEGFTISP